MKKTILTLILGFITSLTFAQQQPVVDTSFQGMTSVYIQPIQPVFTDTAKATLLGAYVVSDNLKNSATFYWALLTFDGKQLLNGNYTMTAEQYAQWCAANNPISCNTFPHYCIGQAYGLTFIPAPSSSSKK
jgi:hypothetical protein